MIKNEVLNQFNESQLIEMFDAIFDTNVANSITGTKMECVLYDTVLQENLFEYFNTKNKNIN